MPSRDFYTSVFGLRSTPGKDSGKRATWSSAQRRQGGSFIAARTAATPANPRPPSQAVIDHIASRCRTGRRRLRAARPPELKISAAAMAA